MGSISERPEAFPNIPPDEGTDIMWDLKVRMTADKSPDKVDLGAGVYRDEQGKYYEIPVVRKVASIQTIGGTGACHIGAVFASQYFQPSSSGPDKRPLDAYIGDPGWPNYGPLFTHAGLNPVFYPYHDAATQTVALDALLAAIAAAPPRSVFVLQAVCHNPTGLDLTRTQWRAVADALAARGHLPFFDIAYQGFGSGLDEDAWPVREFAGRGLEIVVAQSFSKNLGLLENLSEMRERLQKNRKNLHRWLTEELKTPGNWDHILKESGLFSLLGLNPSQVLQLASEDHIHFPTTGRINVAGLTETNVEKLARAVDKIVR
ncbi:putative aspartate aminotransferase [Diplodia seriata]|uniref:Putative aspartate aminotransferase n=1 Tax=Diplodia seriata TaxID=420778 RepID=A0A0G2H0L5_9PEZI|nr:putative aspartate aminotransferase [Diplodia seriata]